MTTVKTLKLAGPEKILIVKPSSLGDIVHSLPFLNSLSKCFPEAEIHWVVAKGFEGLLEGNPVLKKIWVINKSEWRKIRKTQATISELDRLVKGLRAERYDCVIDLQGLFRSGFIAKAARSPVRIGFADAREGSAFFYTHKVMSSRDIHAVDLYLKIAADLGCAADDIRYPLPPVENIRLNLPFQGDYAVMAPGSRNKSKIWPVERYGKLSSLLPLKTVVVGSGGDAGTADEVVRLSAGRAVSLAGRTDLKELIAVIRGSRFMVCNDTGPMHIAAALNIPVFAIFGPTNPVRTGPYGSGHTVIRKEIPCSPCYRKTCGDVRCLDMIGVKEVFGAISRFLNGK